MPALLYRTKMPKPDDPEIIAAICKALSRGHPYATAAALAGIHEETLYHWRYQGQDDIAATEGRWTAWEELSSHAQLVIHIKEAEAGMVDNALSHIRSGGKEWAAYMTLLERRRSQDFGRNQIDAQPPSVVVNIANVLPAGAGQALLAMAQAERAEGTKFLPTGGPESEPSAPAPDSA